jgi:hypothetical protein
LVAEILLAEKAVKGPLVECQGLIFARNAFCGTVR